MLQPAFFLPHPRCRLIPRHLHVLRQILSAVSCKGRWPEKLNKDEHPAAFVQLNLTLARPTSPQSWANLVVLPAPTGCVRLMHCPGVKDASALNPNRLEPPGVFY